MTLILTPWKEEGASPMRHRMNKYDDVTNIEYSKWRDYIFEVKQVILVASQTALLIVEEIKKLELDIRVIMYWWDPVEHTISPNIVPNQWCEKVSFNKRDAKKYGIKYNPQFAAIKQDICKEEIYDISFVGRANGRLYNTRVDILNILKEYCEQHDVCTYFALLYDDDVYQKREFEIKEYIPEKTYYEIEKHSKALLDITEPAYNWMTLRPLEALYFHKKLITNNIDLKEEMLYHPNNVFILGIDPLEDLKSFLECPLYEFENDVFYEYSFEKWLLRF